MWRDLRDSRWIIAKGGLFVLAGVMAGGLLLVESPTLRTTTLLCLTVWCFCRAYYFAFYVIENYIDDRFKYAGLGSAIVYLWNRQSQHTFSLTHNGDIAEKSDEHQAVQHESDERKVAHRP